MARFDNEDSDFAENAYKNLMDLFFTPEINRRKEQGILPENFVLLAAQAILFPEKKPHIVRLNAEVSAEIKLKKGVDTTAKDFWASRDEVEEVNLKEKEFLNCGHVTLIHLKDDILISFDFQYNKQISLVHLQLAEEFLQTSKYTLENNFLSVFIDIAFSTIELLAKTHLLLEANDSAYGKTHSTLHSAFNLRFKNTQSEFEIDRRHVYNQLTDLRKKVRYLEGNVNFKKLDLQAMYETMGKMYNDLCNRVRFDNNQGQLK